MLLIDVFLSRYDDLVDILRGSELKSQLDSTEFQVRLWVPKTLVVNPKMRQRLLFGHLNAPRFTAAHAIRHFDVARSCRGLWQSVIRES
jgi:hypothetical protein